MPDVWQQALGDIDLPDDDGLEIATLLAAGTSVYAWSDGSEKNGVGAHSFTVLPKCVGGCNSIEGDSVTPGKPSLMSSLRCENFGALACALIVLAIEFKYDIQKGGYLQMHIDNMEVVNRTKLGIDAHLATDKCIKTDFDVWRETDHVVGLLKSTVSAAWVKGHQDDLLKKTGNIGPMPRDPHYNIAMDKRAERRRCESVATPSTLPMTTDKASLSINGCYITAKYKSSIKRAYTAPAICTYIKEKTGWTTAVFESVDWPSIGVYMKRLSIAKRAKVVKLMHNWQNTGDRKDFSMNLQRVRRRTLLM